MVETQVQVANLRPLVGAIVSVSSERGHPALEILNDDGSSLVIGTDGRMAVVGWTDSLGQSFQPPVTCEMSRLLSSTTTDRGQKHRQRLRCVGPTHWIAQKGSCGSGHPTAKRSCSCRIDRGVPGRTSANAAERVTGLVTGNSGWRD